MDSPRALSNPLKLRLFPSFSVPLEELDELVVFVVVRGMPVDEESRVTERVNAASKSSRRRMQL